MLVVLRGSCILVVVTASASLLAVAVLLIPFSRSFGAVVHGLSADIGATKLIGNSTVAFMATGRQGTGSNDLLRRDLFELLTPFDSANENCASVCGFHQNEGEESGFSESSLIDACPKCSGRYTPCNFCCYQGASSLKLRFFGCAGEMGVVFDENLVEEKKCQPTGTSDPLVLDSSSMNNEIMDSGVQFVDCDCFDDVTDASSSSFGDVASCTLFDREFLTYDPLGTSASHFDVCLVSTTDFGEGPVANFSHPLPDVLGIEHLPYDDDTGSSLSIASIAVTFFETSCSEKVTDEKGRFSYPLFPGYGKFAGTCPYDGFIDFENEKSRLPDDIVFVGQPPSTSIFYQFIDGTSVGFWPHGNSSHNMNSGDYDGMFFEPTFATCGCRECDDVPMNALPSSAPSSLSPSQSPSDTDSISSPPSENPVGGPNPAPTPSPFAGTPQQPDFSPTNDPVTISSEGPSHRSSSNPSIESSTEPSTADPSHSPSLEAILRPSMSPSISSYDSQSEFPSGNFAPSLFPSDFQTKSPESSVSPSVYPSNVPSDNPTFLVSDVPSVYLSTYPATPLSFFPTSFPVTYRCPPSKEPTDPNETPPVTPFPTKGPIDTSVAPSDYPTTELSTDSPTESTKNPTNHPTSQVSTTSSIDSTQSPSTTTVATGSPTSATTSTVTSEPVENIPEEDCPDESGCFIFGLVNCVDRVTGNTCFPTCDPPSRRSLEQQIEYHQAALAELVGNLIYRGRK